MDIAEAICGLRLLLDEAIKNEKAEGVLLSGGLDTSIIALLAKRHVKGLKAFTVTREGFDKDLRYARRVAHFLELDHRVHFFTQEELEEAALEGARILASSQYEEHVPPHIRGSIIEGYSEAVGPTTFAPLYIAMRFARRYVNSIYSGDGADELFIGYSSLSGFIGFIASNDEAFGAHFLRELEQDLSSRAFQAYDLRYPYMLGEALHLQVRAPYLTPELRDFAREIPAEQKVRWEGGRLWGKWLLRKAFEDYLPKEIVWREKTTIDSGTGALVWGNETL